MIVTGARAEQMDGQLGDRCHPTVLPRPDQHGIEERDPTRIGANRGIL